MQYKIIKTDLMIKGKLYSENLTIELDSLPEGLEQFLVPVNNPTIEVPLKQESVLIPNEESEQKTENKSTIEQLNNKINPELVEGKSKRGRKKSSHV